MADNSGLLIYAIICFILVVIYSIYLVRYYARPNTPVLVLLLTTIGWILTFSICFLVPIDLNSVNNTDTDNNNTDSNNSSNNNSNLDLSIIWSIVYWSSLLLSWAIIPLIQEYYNNGGFTVKQKLIQSLRMNVLLFTIIVLIFLSGIIYLRAVQSMNWYEIKGLIITISNVIGLILLVIITGYGIVELPRSYYYSAHCERSLTNLYYNSTAINHELIDSLDELYSTEKLLRDTELKLNRQNHSNNSNNINELRSAFTIVQLEFNKIQSEFSNNSNNRRGHHPFELKLTAELTELTEININYLMKLHYHVRTLVRHLELVESQWNDTVRTVDRLERNLGINNNNSHNSHSNNHSSNNNINNSTGERLLNQSSSTADNTIITNNNTLYSKLLIVFHNWWYSRGLRLFNIICCILFTLLSLLIIFCEITIVSSTDVSPLGAILKSDSVSNNPIAIQLFSLIPFIYLTAAAYYPLFRLRLRKLYYLTYRRTDENSLLFNITFLLRVSTPLAYNYILLLRINDNNNSIGIKLLIGQISVIPLFGTNFAKIFPIFMAVLAVAILFNLFQYCAARCLNIQSFRYITAAAIKPKTNTTNSTNNNNTNSNKSSSSVLSDEYDEDISDTINEGMQLIAADRRKHRSQQLSILERAANVSNNNNNHNNSNNSNSRLMRELESVDIDNDDRMNIIDEF